MVIWEGKCEGGVRVELLRTNGKAWTQRDQLELFNIIKANRPGNGMQEGYAKHLD